MKRNFNLIFFLKKGKTDPQGASSIYMRITIDKKRAEMATGKSCLDNEWDNGQLKGSTSLVKTINLYLRQIESKVYDAHRHLLMCNDDITAKNLMNEFLGKDRKARKLTEVFEEHNRQMAELIGIEFAPMTLLRYQTALRHLRQYLREKYKIQDIDIRKIDHQFIADYEFFLRTTRKCNNNSAVKYIKNFKKVIKNYLANGWLSKDPFANFKAKIKLIERPCLSEEQVNALENKEFDNERLNWVKDIFLFSCYTGLAYIDIYHLHRSEIIVKNKNEKWININRQKTGTPTRVPCCQKH